MATVTMREMQVQQIAGLKAHRICGEKGSRCKLDDKGAVWESEFVRWSNLSTYYMLYDT